MLSLPFLLLLATATDALVSSSSLSLLQNHTQSFGGDISLDGTSLNAAASSAWLDRASWQSSASSSLAQNNVAADAIYRCEDGLGTDLNRESCDSALLSIEYWLTRSVTWGPRGTGVTYDFPMPQRWVSTDGTCIIQAIVAPGSTSARASLKDVGMGVFVVCDKCVEHGKGGLAKELGDGKLGIFVAKRTPNVRCYGNAAVMAIVNSCQTIINRMDVSEGMKLFGARGVGVDVELPYTWYSADHRCIMTLRTTGPSDREAWYRIWESATSVTAMCASQGKKGAYFQMGLNKNLYLEVAAENVGDVETS